MRTWPLLTLIFGLATLGVFVALGSQPDVTAIYERTQISAAVSAFQRAETLSDIAYVFGSPVDDRVVAAQNAINTLDLYGFIPAYALFLTAAAIMLGGLRNRWTQAAILFGLLGAAFDAVETWQQLRLTADIDNADAYLPIATWHWLKYLALALNGVAVTSIALTAEKRRLILAMLAFLPLPAVAIAYMEFAPVTVFSVAFVLYWVTLLVISIIELVRAKGSPA
ncbi:MAG: hypothetical protein K2P70_13465 [Hyphomonadaceae bacterium]|nr:hypothetical protein [Hyphomonadaceae bacterium]